MIKRYESPIRLDTKLDGPIRHFVTGNIKDFPCSEIFLADAKECCLDNVD